jgi:hypothetical protein
MASETPAYERLVRLVKARHPNQINEKEAHRLARNLMGYVELLININAQKEHERLDASCGNGNLFMRWLFG